MAAPQEVPDITQLRPDIAAMQADMPQPQESAVEAQATAQRDPDGGMYFTYAGTRFYLKHVPDAFDLADLAEYMDRAQVAPIAALGGINRFLREWLVDFDALRSTFRANLAGQGMEAQMREYGAVAASLFEVTAARPTAAPDDSSAGRGPTSTSSKDDSPSPEPSLSTAPGDWQTFIRE